MSGVLGGSPKDEPLHYGEIYGLWQFTASAKMALSAFQAYRYHAGDRDLKVIIDDFIDQVHREIKACDKLLRSNGFMAPPELPDRPSAKLDDIPAGARFTDQEIAAALSSSAAAGMVVCSQAAGISIREDLGPMYMKFHAQMAALGLALLHLNKKKGWLVPPPLQLKHREPALV
ncbi:membrane protein [Paenibacillus sp. FSL R7-0273]|uniref:DUF3231 family protein n=1 Tax=Paenibacillus sp. FSL R7-0273 TaxID=1536772 RepID=UPI0004F5E910|nr:DUF3231 family protein [Paenibacillus sp. FSL R7-0273]AIQ46719.1 membrane protein [Paenibacillus sp. FSL R7-0273]OMF97513.1 hypothetical protein BK144_02390 [Paenibacillus sp. FSL R7-0273]